MYGGDGAAADNNNDEFNTGAHATGGKKKKKKKRTKLLVEAGEDVLAGGDSQADVSHVSSSHSMNRRFFEEQM